MNDRVPAAFCTGCAACRFCCPRGAITMVEDAEGFLYPIINGDKCDACGVCLQVCPVQKGTEAPAETVGARPQVYAAWTKDPDLLSKSSSGGVFSELAVDVLSAAGVVFGAAFDESMTVKHMAVETSGRLSILRGSKYVQSDVGESYRLAKQALQAGRPVLYSGTPCQIAGLRTVLNGAPQGLLTCDLICHGVPSPKVFRLALRALEERYRSKVVAFAFREKTHGWLHPTIRITFEDGTAIEENNIDSHYNLGFLKNIYLRPACHHCLIKRRGPWADITLGDFWQLLGFDPSMVNRGGTSAVVINTEQGRSAFERSSPRLETQPCPFDILETQSNLTRSAAPSPVRQAFFADVERLPFEHLTRKYIRPRNTVLKMLARFRRNLLCKASAVH